MGNKVFCGGLAWGTDDTGLQMAMTEFGVVREAKVITDRDTGRSKGFGFVTFEDAESAQAAVDAGSINLDGRTVRIDAAKEQSGGRRRSGGGDRKRDRY